MWRQSRQSRPTHLTHPGDSIPSNARGSWLRRAALAGALCVCVALLAGCGAASGSASAANFGAQHSVANGAGTANAPSGQVAAGPSTITNPQATPGPSSANQSPAQYLIKSLSVGMAMPDTRITATLLTQWITTTDPGAQTAGATYSQDGDQYDVALTFSVEATYYNQVKSYLTTYADGNKGKLLSLQESVQDVTNDYVDSQSQLSNLRVEQARLQTFMSQAQSVNDLLAIQSQLSNVEGQIEQTEAHLKQLAGQTTYYTVQVQLTPLSTYVPPITKPWTPGPIFQAALSSAKAFGEGLLTILIWLLVYAIYIVPALVIVWLVMRYRRRRRAAIEPALASAPPAPPTA